MVKTGAYRPKYSLKLECVASAANLKRTASREEYQRKKVTKIQPTDCSRCGDYDALLRELEDMKKEATAKLKIVDEQAASIEWLEELLKDNRVVKTKEGKAYTPKMMKCVMELLTDNVNACRVGQAVLKLADMTACHIPSNAIVLNYNVARLVLAQRQLGEDLSREKNTTLLTDETSKFGDKYMGYHTADSQETRKKILV